MHLKLMFTALVFHRGAVLIVAGACAMTVYAQERPPLQEVRVSAKPYVPSAVTLRFQSDLVEVGVVVRGHNGGAIPGLTKEDFRILDQGTPREIASFAVETGPGAAAAPSAWTAGGTVSAGESPPPPAVAEKAARSARFILLFFEDFATNGGDLKRAQIAARRFVNEGLDSGDRIAVSASSGRVLDFTADKSKALAAIDKLRPHPRFSESGQAQCPRITPYQAYLIAAEQDPRALQAAVSEARTCNTGGDEGNSVYTNRGIWKQPGSPPSPDDPITQMVNGQAELTWGQARIVSQGTLDAIGGAVGALAAKPGRRLLLLASSGFLSGTLDREVDAVINQALRAGVVINALDAKGLYAEAPGRPIDEPKTPVLPVPTFAFEASSLNTRLFTANEAMTNFAQSTGGLFFHNNNDLVSGFHLLGSLPEVSYMLGFHPGEIAAEGAYHKLKVNLTASKGYIVEARPGYFALRADAGPGDRRQTLDREVMGKSTSKEFPATATYLSGGQGAKIQIHVDIKSLQFPKRGDRRIQKFAFVVALLDTKENLIAAKEGTMDFALTDATYQRLLESGINAGLNLDAPPGEYRLRTVVQEIVDGKMASSVQSIAVR